MYRKNTTVLSPRAAVPEAEYDLNAIYDLHDDISDDDWDFLLKADEMLPNIQVIM